MSTNNSVFLENIEWFDESGKELIHRIPERGSGEIKWGAQLTVRESQAAVFFYQGKAYDVFATGRHTLKTANFPILTKILSVPWSMSSPLRTEIYFANMKVFANLTWGTRDPVAFRDSELGLIRLRAFGVFNIRVIQPVLFINSLVGTQGVYSTEEIADYLNRVIVSRFNDYMGEHIDTIFNLPARYNELSDALKTALAGDFSQFGMGLVSLYINAITPPPEVQKAIDDKSKLGVFDDLNRLLQMKAAMALESAAQNQGETGTGMGMGMGLMMPAMFADAFKAASHQGPPSDQAAKCSCPACGQFLPHEARFCPACGHQIVVMLRCAHCGENLPAHARFCTQCGDGTIQKPQPRICSQCGTENLSNATFCNHCGYRIQSSP